MTTQPVHGALLRAEGALYSCVVLFRTVQSVELLVRNVTLEVNQRIHLSAANWKTDAIVTQVTRAEKASVVRCALA